jgi:hypothetical protein
MSLSLRVLLNTAMAVLIASAVAASSAGAEFETDTENVTITSTADGTGKNAHWVIDVAGGSITCPGAEVKSTPIASRVFATMFVTVKMTGTCTFLGQTGTVSMNGCGFNLHSNGELDIAGTNCASQPMEISVPSPPCKVTIHSQAGLKGLTFHNIKPGSVEEVTLESHVTGITYTASGSGCPVTGAYSNGTLTTGNAILTAFKGWTGTMAWWRRW